MVRSGTGTTEGEKFRGTGPGISVGRGISRDGGDCGRVLSFPFSNLLPGSFVDGVMDRDDR